MSIDPSRWILVLKRSYININLRLFEKLENYRCKRLSKPNLADMSFDDYIIKFNKVYKNEEEKIKRSKIFGANVKKLKESKCSACGITKFTDQNE